MNDIKVVWHRVKITDRTKTKHGFPTPLSMERLLNKLVA